MRTLILASSSPRRREFMQRLGVNFSIHTADIDETPRPERPDVLAERLAVAKAQAVARRLPRIQAARRSSPRTWWWRWAIRCSASRTAWLMPPQCSNCCATSSIM